MSKQELNELVLHFINNIQSDLDNIVTDIDTKKDKVSADLLTLIYLAKTASQAKGALDTLSD